MRLGQMTSEEAERLLAEEIEAQIDDETRYRWEYMGEDAPEEGFYEIQGLLLQR